MPHEKFHGVRVAAELAGKEAAVVDLEVLVERVLPQRREHLAQFVPLCGVALRVHHAVRQHPRRRDQLIQNGSRRGRFVFRPRPEQDVLRLAL